MEHSISGSFRTEVGRKAGNNTCGNRRADGVRRKIVGGSAAMKPTSVGHWHDVGLERCGSVGCGDGAKEVVRRWKEEVKVKADFDEAALGGRPEAPIARTGGEESGQRSRSAVCVSRVEWSGERKEEEFRSVRTKGEVKMIVLGFGGFE